MESELSFGSWVRQRRRALDLLQKELASRVGCSVTALQKIERDERRPSRQLAERLAECLDVQPDERAVFMQVARGERMVERLAAPRSPMVAAPHPVAHQIAPFSGIPVEPLAERLRPEPVEGPRPEPVEGLLMSLVGRDVELGEIVRLLQDPYCRLLTLVGPGGIGKSRLAMELFAQQHALQTDSAAFVSLAPVVGREQTVTAIADALGLMLYAATDRAAQLIHHLRNRELLIVLDNFEHILNDAACVALVGDLLRGVPALTLLVTSRESLNLQMEWVFDVQGLPIPTSADADILEASSAAQLFLQRARQAGFATSQSRGGSTLSATDRTAIWQICQLVEGLPLGLELAATWVRTLSCQEIAYEIQRTIDFLATSARDGLERHRSLRAVFNQSWILLAADEQQVLRRLAVFRGGFGRDAAAEVAGASLAQLSALVSKSLLRRTAVGRYDLHNLVRQYTLDQLRGDEQEQSATCTRHCQYYAALLERSNAPFKGQEQPSVVADLLAELANIRLAWQWAATHQLAAELSQAADTLFWLYEFQSNCREGMPLFLEAAQSLQSNNNLAAEQSLALGQVLSYGGFCCFRQGDYLQSRTLLQRSLVLLESLADSLSVRGARSTAMAFLGIITYKMGAYTEGRRLLEDGLAIKRALDDRWGCALGLRQLGLAAYSLGDYPQAYRLLSESLALCRAMGNRWSMAFSLNFLGTVAYAQGSYVEAARFLQEGLAISQSLEDRFNIATALSGLGTVHQALGDRQEAQRCFQASITIWRVIGDGGNLAHTLNHLGDHLLAQVDLSGARRCFLEALSVARTAQIAPTMLDALLGIAALHAQNGTLADALELALHVLHDPASTQSARTRAEQLRGALATQLPADEKMSEADVRNTTLDEVVRKLLDGSS